MRSPFSSPRDMSPRAVSRTASPNSVKVTSTHSPPCLCFSAVRSPCLRAASSARSAMVFDPVLASTAGMSATSKLVPPLVGGASLCLGERRVRASRVVLQRRQEQRLVDPTLEDRHAHLHALRDDLTTVHPSFAREFGGGQVDRHSQSSCGRFCVKTVLYRLEGTVPTLF